MYLFVISISVVYHMFVNTVYTRTTMTHYDFAEATKCRFLKIIMDRRGFGISTMLPNIRLITLPSISFIYLIGHIVI
jgi:hypothetical protein